MNANLPQIKNMSIREQTLDRLREALRILNSEGLVETIPYHGTSVRPLTKVDIEVIYSMRILLKTYALERVIQAADRANLARLRAVVDAMVSAGASGDLIADDWVALR